MIMKFYLIKILNKTKKLFKKKQTKIQIKTIKEKKIFKNNKIKQVKTLILL